VKWLIVDKSVFHGTACRELVRFVKCHRVILPHALCVECAISQKGDPPKESKDPIRLMQKLVDVVKSGAYAGKSPGKIVEEERSRNATIESIVDMEETQVMREGTLDEEGDLEKVRQECEKAFKPIIDFVKEWASRYHKNIRKKKLENDFRDEVDEGDLVRRLGKWLHFTNKAKDDILDHLLGTGSNAMSADRWEWQMLRLSLAWGTELASKRNKSGSSFEDYNISNDIFGAPIGHGGFSRKRCVQQHLRCTISVLHAQVEMAWTANCYEISAKGVVEVRQQDHFISG